MNCETCKEARAPDMVPYIAHEADMARLERVIKRLWIVVLLLVVLLVGSNCAWMYYENQFEDVETTGTQTIEADQDGNGTNIVGGGDVIYGAEG